MEINVNEPKFWIVYGLVGCVFTGILSAINKKKQFLGDFPPELLHVVGPAVYPLMIPGLLIYATRKLTYYVLYAKQERVEKVTNKLTGRNDV